MNTLHALI